MGEVSRNRRYCDNCKKDADRINSKEYRERKRRERHMIQGNSKQLSDDVYSSIMLSNRLNREITYGHYMANWKGKQRELEVLSNVLSKRGGKRER